MPKRSTKRSAFRTGKALTPLNGSLNNALMVMIRVTKGQQTVQGMGEWISWNYPRYRSQLPKSMRTKP